MDCRSIRALGQTLASITIALAFSATASATPDGLVTTIDVPGSTSTLALDINASGTIVGRYLRNSQTHGFMRSPDGEFLSIDVPDASFTVAVSINDRGDVVGQYAMPTAPAQRHGFLLKDGEFSSFDPPGSTFTNVLGINERGDIVGRYCTLAVCAAPGNGSFHGFVLRDGAFTTFDIDGAIETDLFKVNGRGDIAGGFATAAGDEQMFLSSDQGFTAIAAPDGHRISLDNGGLNERGDVVGTYCDVASPCLIVPKGTHGFLVSDGEFVTIDIPGATATSAAGINARGDIVGGYSDGARFHGYVLSRN